ncbi:MAG: CDP-alcohol phosphatidyltransferase family protein [Spirochaetes bacterium]|nr:CDP-alcohol phosphatidyltransferase family protein [Spirochaetota bacterium]
MTTADKLTASRLVLAPFFFMFYFIPPYFSVDARFVIPVLWGFFIVMELTDLFDGMAARRNNSASDFGKLFDPFADVIARLTYFLCFAFTGLMPLWVFLLVVYREYGILFIRLLAARRGVAMGARPGGKLKAVVYMVAGSVSMIMLTLNAFGWLGNASAYIATGSFVVYCIAGALSVGSFADYLLHYRSLSRSPAP